MSKIGRFGIFSDVKFGSQLELKDCTFESVNYAEIQVNEAKVEHTHKLEDSSHEYFTSHQLCQLLNLTARSAKGLLDDHKTIVFFLVHLSPIIFFPFYICNGALLWRAFHWDED